MATHGLCMCSRHIYWLQLISIYRLRECTGSYLLSTGSARSEGISVEAQLLSICFSFYIQSNPCHNKPCSIFSSSCCFNFSLVCLSAHLELISSLAQVQTSICIPFFTFKLEPKFKVSSTCMFSTCQGQATCMFSTCQGQATCMFSIMGFCPEMADTCNKVHYFVNYKQKHAMLSQRAVEHRKYKGMRQHSTECLSAYQCECVAVFHSSKRLCSWGKLMQT